MDQDASVKKSVELMSKLDTFEGLDHHQLIEIAELGDVYEFGPDVVLFREGDVGDKMFIIVQGSLEVTSKLRPQVFLLGVGEVLGEIGLLDGLPRTATVTTADNCLLLGLTREQLETTLDSAPKFVLNIMTVTNRKIRAALGREVGLNVSLREANTELERLNGSLEGMVELKTQQMHKASESLGGMLETDALTGALTRQKFDSLMNDLIGRRCPFSLIFLDLDHFAAIKDTHGEQTSQRVLIKLAEITTDRLAGAQHLARFAGEKFALLLEDCGAELAQKNAESIRSAIENHHFPIRGCAPGYVTASMGVAHYPTHGLALIDVCGSAEGALSRAKQDGCNRVVGS
jgi:diguanylate cyclase (GGDEF)-like protein